MILYTKHSGKAKFIMTINKSIVARVWDGEVEQVKHRRTFRAV